MSGLAVDAQGKGVCVRGGCAGVCLGVHVCVHVRARVCVRMCMCVCGCGCMCAAVQANKLPGAGRSEGPEEKAGRGADTHRRSRWEVVDK